MSTKDDWVIQPEDQRIQTFMMTAQRLIDDSWRRHEYTFAAPPRLFLDPGLRYLRIWSVDDGGASKSRSCWGFIDLMNGDILKPESWKKPAKHARGNIFDPWGGTKYLTEYGPMYMDGLKRR